MLAVMLVTVPTSILADAAAGDEQAGFGFTTGLVGIVQSQTARLSVWNNGTKTVIAKLQFVDGDGKVLISWSGAIPAGKSTIQDLRWPCCGGQNRIEFQAQYGATEKKSAGLLVATVQIMDGTSNANAWVIGPDGFVECSTVTFGGS
jgi:hypothetical protein